MLVRRFSEAPTIEVHRLRSHILMDAGELGSRNLSVNWIEVPPGASEDLALPRGGRAGLRRRRRLGRRCPPPATRQELAPGDFVMIPPATEHSVSNDGTETLALVSVQSPGVSADELFSIRLASQAAGYDAEYEDE